MIGSQIEKLRPSELSREDSTPQLERTQNTCPSVTTPFQKVATERFANTRTVPRSLAIRLSALTKRSALWRFAQTTFLNCSEKRRSGS